ncbi:hypothetical protein SLEP1_g3151 [Rubroshorea leprosula]|uniref:PRONE domain-containing protein n=1 Tax=Rubroshorea leprosula TaxID=152421 RepID=A0AAV5HNS9_9ROSI|nr:hypothetical protein SLEP1_g3151 [Rubroshorea leprosula]
MGSSSPPLLGWPIRRATVSKSSVLSDGNGEEDKTKYKDSKFKKLGSKVLEIEMMKERFAKLLLGEDMSGSGKGVCIALAISNTCPRPWFRLGSLAWPLQFRHPHRCLLQLRLPPWHLLLFPPRHLLQRRFPPWHPLQRRFPPSHLLQCQFPPSYRAPTPVPTVAPAPVPTTVPAPTPAPAPMLAPTVTPASVPTTD